MPSWALHERWARRLGVDPVVARFVNRLIDRNGGLHDFVECELARLRLSELEWRAVLLHGLMDSLRYLLVELGSAVAGAVRPEDILEVARDVRLRRNLDRVSREGALRYSECVNRLGRELGELVEELRPLAGELVRDIAEEARREGAMRDVGCLRVRKEYLKQLVEKNPGLLEAPALQKDPYALSKLQEALKDP
ncbi:MAG: hypothetical protein QXS85_06215 [Acidilobaceae archaeon]